MPCPCAGAGGAPILSSKGEAPLGSSSGSRSSKSSKSSNPTTIPLLFDSAYVINLKKHTDRWNATQKQFAALLPGLVPTRVDAVYGAELCEDDVAANTTTRCSNFCTPATVGCAMSHVKVWEEVLKRGDRWALVCEDDVEFEEGAAEKLAAVWPEVPLDAHVVYLGCAACSEETSGLTRLAMKIGGMERPAVHTSEHVWQPPTALGTHCYLVSAAGAKLLLANVKGRISTHIDIMMNGLAKRGIIVTYAVRPLLARQIQSISVSSIADAKFPRLMNQAFDKVQVDKDLTLGYMVNSPLGRFGRFPVTAWFFIFPILGIILGLAGCPLWLFLTIMLIPVVADIAAVCRDWNDRDTKLALAVNVPMMLLGWIFGFSVRTAIKNRRFRS